MIENPVQTRRALLVWLPPLFGTVRRRRHEVAQLVQRADGVSFQYFSDEQLKDAKREGFDGYPGLPLESDDPGGVAMDLLMRRLPPREREDFGGLLERFGLPSGPSHSYSDLSLLAYTGARLTSDGFSVCETFEGFEAPFTYVFDVAGNRHYQQLYTELAIGEPMYLKREDKNEFDSNAVRIAREDDTTVGFINRLQAKAVRRYLEECEISASVFRTNGRPEYPRLFVRVEMAPNASALAA